MEWPLRFLLNLSLFDEGCNNASVYGSNCDIPCPANCKDSTCHIESGACSLCKPGWTGVKCNTSKMGPRFPVIVKYYFNYMKTFYKDLQMHSFFTPDCREGWYGVNCSKQCSGHCKDDTPCYQVTGHCESKCAAGWTGLQCDKGIRST